MVPESLSSSGLGGGQAMPGKEPSPSERLSLQSSPPRSIPWATTRSEAGEMEGEADRTGGQPWAGRSVGDSEAAGA